MGSTSTTENQFANLPTFKDFVPQSPSPPTPTTQQIGNSTDLKLKTEDLDELLHSNEMEVEEPLFKSKTKGPEGIKERVEELKVSTEGFKQRFLAENGKKPKVREKEAFALAKLMALVEQSIDEVEELLQLIPTYDSEEEREKKEREEQQRKEEMLKESEQEMQLAQQMTNFSNSPFPIMSMFEAQFYKQIKPRMRKKNNPKSQYHGCFWCPSLNKWAGGYVVGGKHKMLKKGHDEHEVAQFVRKEVRRLNKQGIKINLKYGDLKGKKYSKINKKNQREAAQRLEQY